MAYKNKIEATLHVRSVIAGVENAYISYLNGEIPRSEMMDVLLSAEQDVLEGSRFRTCCRNPHVRGGRCWECGTWTED